MLADLAETAEHWLKSASVPRPLRPPADRIGGAVGGLARAYRPPPSDMPPPEEELEAESAMPAVTHAHRAASKANGHSDEEGRKPRAKASKAAPKARASARRSPPKKRAQAVAPVPEPKAQRKTNGKGRTKRPSARRTRDDKSQKPS